ncbi:hypothetical protein KY285_020482 [Solanum tuberosum]|nr:hypothetical protein KY285_020482 [Solanum tuberosum]
MHATIKRLQSLFYWKSLAADIRNFIQKCDICQRHKYDTTAYPGLLQPLPIPDGVWVDISLDFIEGLPKSKGKDVILVVVDRFNCMVCQLLYTTYHSTLKCTPYEVLYGQKPPIHLPYLASESSNDLVDRSLVAREVVIALLKLHLTRAHQNMRDKANKHRSDRQIMEGDWVYLKLQPCGQISVVSWPFNKLAAKYFGPYLVLSRVGAVAYKLLLPADVLIHPVFHVSQLKRCYKVPTVINHPPVLHLSSPYCPIPESVLEIRMVKKGNKVVCQVLV